MDLNPACTSDGCPQAGLGGAAVPWCFPDSQALGLCGNLVGWIPTCLPQGSVWPCCSIPLSPPLTFWTGPAIRLQNEVQMIREELVIIILVETIEVKIDGNTGKDWIKEKQ